MQKSHLLYGLPQALGTTGPVYLCEGPTDVWRVGPGAVAILGHDLSEHQKMLAMHYFAGRPIVILPDQDAIDAAREIQRRRQPGRGRHVAAGP
jgi:DNA primase